MYIDDNLIVRDIQAIHEVIAAIKENGPVLKIKEGLKENLFCKITCPARLDSQDKERASLGQSNLIDSLEKQFSNQNHETPGMPKFLLARPMIDTEKNSAEDQKEYWSKVGILLFLVKHNNL